MAGRQRHAVTGALAAVALAAGLVAVLPDGVTSALGARAVAWTSGQTPSASDARPRAGTPATASRARRTTSSALTSGAAAGSRKRSAGRSGTAALKCSCRKSGTVAHPQAARMGGPQIVRGDNPPSVTLLPPGTGGVDRGIADTGVHSDGRWHASAVSQRYHPGSQATLTATPSAAGATTGSVAVSWNDIGDPATISYRIGYQPQTWVRPTQGSASWTYPAITWVTVPPGTVPGLLTTRTWTLRPATHGVRYIFWLEVDVSTPEDVLGSTRMLLAHQEGVLVP